MKKSLILCQLKSVLGVMTLTLVEGMAIGWASPAIEKMSKNEAPFTPMGEDVSQIVSLFDIGSMLGAWVSTFVFTIAGRRQTILVGPIALSLWVTLTAIGTSAGMLITARIMGGMGMGIVLSFVFIYVGEVTMPSVRGPFILATTLLMPTGQLIAFLVGARVPWLWQSLYPVPFLVLLFAFIFFLMEETPYYYASKDRPSDVLKSLRALRQGLPDDEIRAEADGILLSVKQERDEAVTWMQMFAPPGAKKAAIIVVVESSSLALLGVTNVLAYTQQIFTFTKGNILEADISGVLVIVVEIIMICVAMVLIERLGRRLQLTLAAMGTCLSMLLLTVYCGLGEVGGKDLTSWNWVPLLCLLVYIGSVGGGVNTVPQVLMSEMLDQRAKAVIAPVCMTIMALTSFGINYAFLPVGQNNGFWVPFLFFTCTNACIALFTLIVVPETKGKSLAEVQDMLRGRNVRKEPL